MRNCLKITMNQLVMPAMSVLQIKCQRSSEEKCYFHHGGKREKVSWKRGYLSWTSQFLSWEYYWVGNDNGKEVHGKGKLQEEKTEGSQTCRVQVCKSSSLATTQGAWRCWVEEELRNKCLTQFTGSALFPHSLPFCTLRFIRNV